MKTKHFMVVVSVGAALIGCSKDDRSANMESTSTNRFNRSAPLTSSATDATRDRSESVVNAVTPPVVSANYNTGAVSPGSVTNTDPSVFARGDSATSESDIGIIQRIRKSFLTDDSVAAVAGQVTIVCREGNVVLRGTVPTEIVKMSVGDRAKAVADVKSVDNQLKVQ